MYALRSGKGQNETVQTIETYGLPFRRKKSSYTSNGSTCSQKRFTIFFTVKGYKLWISIMTFNVAFENDS